MELASRRRRRRLSPFVAAIGTIAAPAAAAVAERSRRTALPSLAAWLASYCVLLLVTDRQPAGGWSAGVACFGVASSRRRSAIATFDGRSENMRTVW